MKLNTILSILVVVIATSSCSKNDESTTTSPTTTTTTPVSTAPPAEPAVVISCDASTGVSKIVCLVDALKAQLSTAQVNTLQLSYSKTDAVKWSNFPQQLFNLKRVGINLGVLNATQIAYVKALVKEMAGSSVANEGWSEIQQILNADDYLNTVNSNGGYGSGNYYIAILGTPSTTGKFAIQFGGHHLAFQNTYNNGVLAGATPSFRGIEPIGSFTYNNTTNAPLEQEKNAFLAVLNSFSTTELAAAKLASATSDLVAGPQQENIPTTYSGVKCSTLTTSQKQLVLEAIKTYVNDVANNADFLTTYTNELDNTYVSYTGNKTLAARGDYIRIHGPNVWIEWAVQPAIALPQAHIHSVWRDRSKDYGGN